jgi:hypothetical protein
VKTTFKILSSSGQVIGQRKLAASFTGRHAKGTLGGTDLGCTNRDVHVDRDHS